MEDYIRYHKQPYSTFHTIREFNEQFGTSIEEQKEYEVAFKAKFDWAKKMQGPDEYLQVQFPSPYGMQNNTSPIASPVTVHDVMCETKRDLAFLLADLSFHIDDSDSDFSDEDDSDFSDEDDSDFSDEDD